MGTSTGRNRTRRCTPSSTTSCGRSAPTSTGAGWLERTFDPEAVRRLKTAAERDLTAGGPELAAHAFRELQLLVAPIVVGGGKRVLPADVRVELELLDERRFGNGMVHLRYRTGT